MIDTQTQKIFPVSLPVVISDNAAIVTAAIDTLGYDYLDVYFMFGAMDIAMAALSIGQSDTDGSYVALADFATLPATLPSATSDGTIFAFHVNLIGKKRYFDVTATTGDGNAGTYACAWAVLSRAGQAANSATTRGIAQEIFC